MTTWGDIKRSDKPLNYKRILEQVGITPERLNTHIHQLLREKAMNTSLAGPNENDEVVDMDELQKNSEVLDDATIEEDPDKEPDSELGEDDEIEDDVENMDDSLDDESLRDA